MRTFAALLLSGLVFWPIAATITATDKQAGPRPCECHQKAPCLDARCPANGGKGGCECATKTTPVAPSPPRAAPALELENRQFGQFVFLLAKTDATKVKFVPLTPGLERVPPEFVPQTDKSAVFHAKHGGTYSVLAYTAKGDEPSDPVIKTFMVDGPEPTPPPVPPVPPGPGPKPDPVPPQPGTKTFWIVVVEDEDGPDPDQAALLADEAFWDSLKARGHSFRQYRPESAAAKERKYVEQGQAVGLPALLLIERDPGKQPAAKVKLTGSKADVEAAIKAAGGK